MNKLKNKSETKKIILWAVLSALAAVATLTIIYVIKGVIPFGENPLLRNDAFYQYNPLLVELSERLKEGSSLLYSWQSGFGTNFFGTMLYYLVNPFNLISLFFSPEKMPLAFSFIVMLSTGLIAFNTSIYLQKHFNKSDIMTIAFSLIYTFCGFYVTSYFNVMWLIPLAMLPIVMLGIEKIVKGGMPYLYCISLCLTIIFNFYLGFMVCIFSLLYFFTCLFANPINHKGDKREKKETLFPVIFKFILFSLLSAGIAAVVILPTLYSLANAFYKDVFGFSGSFFFNIFEFIKCHINGVVTNQFTATENTVPAVAISSFALILVPLFFFAKKIKLNEKLAYVMLVAILIISFEIPMANYLWHGMSAPACFPYRFVFVYSFVLMLMAYKAFLNIREMPKWAIAIPSALITGLYVYAFMSAEKAEITNLIITASFSVAFIVLIVLMQNIKKGKMAVSIVAFLCVAAEIIACNYDFIKTGIVISEYAPYYDEVANVKAELSKNNEKFYRMDFVDANNTFIPQEKLAQLSGMTASLYGYNGVSTFSSLADWKFASSQFAFGNNGNSGNCFGYTMQTPLYNTMFGVEYVMDNANVLKENKHYELAVDNGEFKTYKNADYVGLGMMVSDKIEKWTPYKVNAFDSQASLWNLMTNNKNPFVLINPAEMEYIGCKPIEFDEVKKAQEEQAANAEKEEIKPPVHHHEHEHEHEGEEIDDGEYKSAIDILKQMGGTYLYKRTNQNEFSIKLELTPEKAQNIYINYNSGTFNKMAVVSDKTGEMNFKLGGKGLVDIGYRSAGEKITVTLSASSYEGFKENDLSHDDAVYFVAMGIDEEIFDDGMKTIRENGVFNLTEFEETNVKGTVNAKNDGYLMMSMPYDEGWTILVDGKETEIFENDAHIMTFHLTKGEHTIEMKYFPMGLRDGLFVSGASILALALSILVIKMRKERFSEEEKSEENPDGEIQE